ncbi:MAG TPA: transglutaminaseTgpA domain-containing protein [Gaiellales bacterium]|nr:transglutaminaseTgpA domain-containing protein [Gaiellales bacterium]
MAERLVVYFAVAVFSAWHWQRLERPEIPAAEMALLILLALAPALLAATRRWAAAIGTAVAAFVVVVWRAFGYLPWERGHALYPVRLGSAVHDGAQAWFGTITPFDPERFAQTDGLVQLSFALLLALFAWLLLDGRFALTAVSAAFALFAIPSTAVGMGDRGLRAAIFLGLALAILAVCQRRIPAGGSAIAQLAAIAAATVVAGVVVGSAPGVAKGAFFDWRHWNPLAGGGARVSVGYVWNETYGPLHFPKNPTTVFTVSSINPHYWKAGVLTEFNGSAWQLQDVTQAPYHDTDSFAAPPSMLPPNAQRPKHNDVVQIGIKIDGLADPHLIGTGQPMRFTLTSQRVDATLSTDGTAVTSTDLPRDATYTVRSYAPNPTVKELADAGTRFPADVAAGIIVAHQRIPVWGSGQDGRRVPIDPSLVRASDQAWHESGADDPAASEYGAVAALESYFHGKQFHYDQTPPRGRGPVLADFMLRSHRGYCQMFSGAMALVLRLHGIPARVAFGFTEGHETSDGDFKVLDRDAHAWVEAYFPGYGWMPFEPTPTRHLPVLTSTTNDKLLTLVANRQEASKYGLPIKLQKTLGLPSSKTAGGNPDAHHGGASRPGGHGVSVTAAPTGGHASFFIWAVSATMVVLLVVAAVKLVAVRWRYLRRGPRGQASAAYHEMATYLGDQGVQVPPNATFEELAAIVDAAWGVDASGLASAGSAARYAPPAAAREAGRRVRPALRRTRREMRAALSLRERAMGALRLRSMLAQTTHLE